ncbi:MAG TPA: UDP-N-acetylmuramate dehydrogenase, partial [Gammaproteobacteria bacterium]|nr:UDP-N-acetylmuramate dehydrogenase [Gammaproteobacteria bacterium]
RRILADLPAAIPVHWLGLGSNLLVRDGGIRGAVIATGSLARELERVDERRVRASAGLACMLLAKRCVRWQLGPAAFFAGIPGTVGGALAMNAGAFGGETWTHVESVTTVDRGGEVRERPRAEFEISYRTVRGPANEWFLGATFRFDHDASSSMDAIKALLARRNAAQPLGVPSCGSVFRNPPGDFAGRLIEQAGLKGLRRGGAMVSDKHANFILNVDDATAADIEALIGEVQAAVQRASGVLLEPEVRVIGEPLGTQAKGDR